MSKEQVKVSALLEGVTPEKAYEAYTAPEHITKWNFASDDWCCPSASNDLRPGGKYSSRMEAKDGSMGFDFEAIYDEVKPNELLRSTMTDGRRMATSFEAKDGGTQVTTVFDPEDMNPVEMQQQGWQSILDNYKKYTESRRS